MTETGDSTSYINTFLTERPKDGMDQIQSRLRSALKLNDEMADYFKERAIIEDTYAKNLAKLNKKVFITDKQALGNLRPTWVRLQNELIDTSAIHATFATKILDDIEKALRSAITTNQVYADIRSMDTTLQKLTKEYDERQGKLVKLKKALEKNGKKSLEAEAKYTEAKEQLDMTKLDWQQSGTNYIQKFQTVDERRWSDIKNYLLQFETVHVEQMLKRVQLAKDNLTSVSDFSVENEIKSSSGQYTTNGSSATSIPFTMTPLDSAMSSTSLTPTDASQLYDPVSPPSLLIDISDDPVNPQSTLSTASFTSTQTRQASTPPLSSATEGVYNDQSDIISQRRGSNAPSITPSKKSDKQRKFLSTLSIRLKPKSSGSNRSNQNHLDLPDFATEKAPSFMDNASVYSVQEEEPPSEATRQIDQQSSLSSSTLQTPPILRKISSFSDSFFNQPSPPQSQQQQQQQQQQQPSAPNIPIDDEGFSIPPPDRSPWTTTDTAPTSSSSSGDDQQDTSDLTSMDSASLHGSLPPRFKLDIKTDSVVQEDATSSQVVLTRVASMLKESNPTNTTKRSRGRRELRSQLFRQENSLSPGHTTTTLLPPACASSTVTLGGHLITPTTSDDPTTVNSISRHETPVSPFAYDDDGDNDHEQQQQQQISNVNQLGLSVTPSAHTKQQQAICVKITEIIHARIRQGQVERIMVTGQVALLYEGQNDAPTTPLRFLIKHNGTETTFMADSIQQMEETDQGIVYQWTPSSLSTEPDQQQQGGSYITCLHYQQCQDEPSSSGLVVPLLVKPMWKCDGDQARLIIKYSKTATAASKALDQVMMVTHVGGGCYGAQSIPTGQWMVDQQRMMWSLVDSQQDEEEQVIRAKFATTSQATPQPIAVRFEMQHQLVSSLQVVEHVTSTTSSPWARISKVDKYTKSGKYIAEV